MNKGGEKQSEYCLWKEHDETTKNHILVQHEVDKHENELRQ
jgi:hypothetical protein